MIFDALLDLVFAVITFVFDLLPAWDAPEAFSVSGMSRAVGGLIHNVLGSWVDMTLFAACIDVVLGAWGVYMVVKVALWVYDKLPGKAA